MAKSFEGKLCSRAIREITMEELAPPKCFFPV